MLDHDLAYALLAFAYLCHGLICIVGDLCKTLSRKRHWRRAEHVVTIFVGVACVSAAVTYWSH